MQTFSKRKKQTTEQGAVNTECSTTMASNNPNSSAHIQQSDNNHSRLQPTTTNYHSSVLGGILNPLPSNNPSDIFAFLRHGNFDAFRRSIDCYHAEVVQMRNDYEQTILHVLVIHAYDYVWVRLVMMRGCDMRAQDADGYTAAHHAVARDDINMLKALTVRVFSQVRPIPESHIVAIHQQGLAALSVRQKDGMTVFMLACLHGSLKCIDYLLELGFNDVAQTDVYGDTCLHYAIARRNKDLIDKLLTDCGGDVNGGDPIRPSILDVLQYNREQQKPFERVHDDAIEKDLLLRGALNRFAIRRTVNKRKASADSDESLISNLACLSINPSAQARAETGRTHARIAAELHHQGDMIGAQKMYTQALNCVADDTLDWALYTCQNAVLYAVQGENKIALKLMRRALDVRKTIEKESEKIEEIQRMITSLEEKIATNAN